MSHPWQNTHDMKEEAGFKTLQVESSRPPFALDLTCRSHATKESERESATWAVWYAGTY